ncbi:uncharacterized protein CIMG_13020 [Coccidioides immitis RS]|uniref:Uncharacterized protein n=1 Tax=Coccidioides immitis (strain RS) TaxID=246410 RepID=A0A0D8JT95_COCIM|nr:uncharacterized protein CIMG_13020 [Coccidioides immitis RS]KJF60517.1 hypothetical protein CIMG_13020 [Coccidioides immitis RS]
MTDCGKHRAELQLIHANTPLSPFLFFFNTRLSPLHLWSSDIAEPTHYWKAIFMQERINCAASEIHFLVDTWNVLSPTLQAHRRRDDVALIQDSHNAINLSKHPIISSILETEEALQP